MKKFLIFFVFTIFASNSYAVKQSFNADFVGSSIVDLKAKTLKSSSGELFIQAVSVEREELLGYLSNIKIIHYKKNPNNTVSIERTEVGNANTILNLGI